MNKKFFPNTVMDKKFEKTLNLIQNKTLRENFNV